MVANSISPDIMSEIFQLRKNTHYHLRHTLQFMAHQIHSFYKGSRSGLYLGPKGWELIPPEIKAIGPIQEFNNKKKKRNGNLMIVLVDSAKFSLTMLVLFKINLYIGHHQLAKACSTLVAENAAERCYLGSLELAVKTPQ